MADDTTTPFLELPDVLPQFIASHHSRATGAGLDPHEYARVTAQLTALQDWPEAFRTAARGHLEAAERSEAAGHGISAGEAFRTAARWFHYAVLLPHPDRETAALAATEADQAMGRALAHLDPDAVRLAGPSFAGWLRRPARAATPRPPVVIVVPGLDSGKEEFHDVTDALLRRGVATFTMDGPGQGVLAATTTPRADYHHVIGEVIDALEAHGDVDATATGVIGLSLGGFYAAVCAAYEPRIRATATVSGPYRLRWEEAPPFVTDTLSQRTGGRLQAEEFAGRVDLRGIAARIGCPLRVVDGGADVIPGVTNGEPLAREAPRGEYLLVPHGDHLLGNARADWLPSTCDWLVGALR
ncbi:alpha/beta hydrolase family protein [Streptomyces sp. NPDC052301]|uniref:alpha/beta hydrolase family protein n=1 Tax=Streptomyces sp. NPDC052301 TaxID=3365687 RepID=UPI0037D3FE52